MAAKKLNVGHRDALKSLANKLIAQTLDTSALDKAYAACAKAISAHMKKRYPPADMAVLEKYGVARADDCIYVSTGGSNYERFEFRKGDDLIPVRPGGRYDCNSRTPILLSDSEEKAFEAFKSAKRALDTEREQRRKDFYTLIDSARTYEELVAIWPAADQLRERILSTSRAICVMSDEVVARIRADAAFNVELPA